MPKPKNAEKGERESISVRAGIDIPRFGGVNAQEDPGAIGDHEFAVGGLINIRHKGTKLVNRPGMAKIHTNALEGEVRGLFDPLLHGGTGGDPDLQEVSGVLNCTTVTGYGATGSRLYWVGRDGCTGDFLIYHYAPEQSPTVQKIYTDAGATPNAFLGHYGIHQDSDKLWITTGFYGPTVGNPTSSGLITYIVRTLPARHFNAKPVDKLVFSETFTEVANAANTGQSGSAEFLRDRYFSNGTYPLSGEDAVLRVWRYDGLTKTIEDTVTLPFSTSVTYPQYLTTALTVYREELIASFGGWYEASDTNQAFTVGIRRRSTAGVWSTVALPGGVTSFAGSNGRAAVYKDKLYIFGWGVIPAAHATNRGGIVMSYDGSVLAVAQNTITGSDAGSSSTLRCPVVFNGYLYYLHTPTNTTDVYVGRFDGTTWDNTHKKISTQFPVEHGSLVTFLEAFRGNLVTGIYKADSPTASYLVASPGTSTGSTWVALVTSANNSLFANNTMQAIAGPIHLLPQYGFSTGVL